MLVRVYVFALVICFEYCDDVLANKIARIYTNNYYSDYVQNNFGVTCLDTRWTRRDDFMNE